MIYNGPENSLKGHVFDVNKPDSLPRYVRQMSNPNDQVREAMALNDRYRIVEQCATCNRALIAEELLAHKMNHVPGKIRAVVRTIMATSLEDRHEIIEWVNKLESV